MQLLSFFAAPLASTRAAWFQSSSRLLECHVTTITARMQTGMGLSQLMPLHEYYTCIRNKLLECHVTIKTTRMQTGMGLSQLMPLPGVSLRGKSKSEIKSKGRRKSKSKGQVSSSSATGALRLFPPALSVHKNH